MVSPKGGDVVPFPWMSLSFVVFDCVAALAFHGEFAGYWCTVAAVVTLAACIGMIMLVPS